MHRVVRSVFLITLLAITAPPSWADTWSTVAAPSAAFEIAGVPALDDRAQLMLRLIRVIHSLPTGHRIVDPIQRRLTAMLDDPNAIADGVNADETVRMSRMVEVPLPLDPKAWSEAIFQRAVPPRALFRAIITDRNASLLYYGLCALTPETREFLRSNPEVLQWIYRERAGTLAAYGGSVRIINNRVDVPGGEEARRLWEGLVGGSVSRPAEFLKELLGHDEGRLAYLYESIDLLDPPRQRFALGLSQRDAAIRAERFRALYRAFADIEAEWSHISLPFARPMYDAAMLLQTAHVTRDGKLAEPASRRLWRGAFDSLDIPDDPARALADPADDDVLDAAGIAELVAVGSAKDRRDRFEAFAFGQRVLGTAPAGHLGDVLVALRAYARFPSVMLIVERLGVTSAPTYAAMARHALAIARIDDPARHIPLQAQFQGALAILDRLVRTGSIDSRTIEPLLASLPLSAPEDAIGYRGGIAAWIETKLLPAIGRTHPNAADGAERLLIAAFADVGPSGVGRFEWEGLAYDVRITASETRRIEATRAKQAGNSLDAVLAFARDVAAIAAPDFSVDRVTPAVASIRAHAARLTPGRPWAGMNADEVPDLRSAADRAARELAKIKNPRHAEKAARLARPLMEAADYLLGEVLVALTYAPLLGDPDNLVGGEADVAHKHDFGAGTAVNDQARKRTPWLRPRQPNGATLVGAILGLDLALAPRALRRLASDRVPELPRLKQNDREAFTTSVVLMNPRHLSGAALSRVAAGVRTGRRRVRDAGSNTAALDELAAAARMSVLRRQLLAWTARHDERNVPNLFSMTELLEIGDPAAESARHEIPGLTEEPLTGCYCSRFPSPGPWEVYSGRPGTGQLATRLPDLMLRITELLDELKAPAALLPAVLSVATQDFIDEVPALYADDWQAAVAYAQAVSRERVEDYISSLTAAGPLRPVSSNQP